MNAGMFDRVIELQKETITIGEFKDKISTFIQYAKVRAAVRFLKGDDVVKYNQDTNVQTLQFKIRYLNNVSVYDVVVYEGKRYNIESIEEIGRKEGLVLVGSQMEG